MKYLRNVLSALIQNFDTVESVIETSANSAGSALKENERYLNSIQGKIDQFNNAMQAMWSNALNSDVVKGFVSLGTELIKIIDDFGMLKSLIFAIGTYLIKTKFNGDLFGNLFGSKEKPEQSVDQMKKTLAELQKARDDAATALSGDAGNKSKQKKLNAAQLNLDNYEKSARPQIEAYEEHIKQTEEAQAKLNKAQEKLSKSQAKLANYQEHGNKDGVKKDSTIKAYTNEVNRAQKEVDELTGKMQQAQVQTDATGNAGLTAGQKIKTGFLNGAKAVGSFAKQLITSMATAYAMAAAFELLTKLGEGVAQWFDDDVLGDSVEELQEKFAGLEGELSDAESEIERLTGELDATNEALAELLAKDAPSFVEKEELERLQTQSAELERQVKLAKELRDNLQVAVNEAAINATGAYLNETSFASETSKSERIEEAGSTGQSIGTVAGYALGTTVVAAGVTKATAAAGAAIGGKIGTALGTVAPGVGNVIGLAVGTVAGALIGKVIGEATAGKKYEEEQTVQEAIDNMPEQRAELQKLRDDAYEAYSKNPEDEDLKTAWNEASANLSTYDQNMAKHVSQIQQAYNAIEVTADTDASTKAYKQQLGDIIDQYNMAMGGEGAKEVAINRVFDDGGFEDAKKAIDYYVQALADGDKSAAGAIEEIINDSEELKEAFSAKNLDPQDAINYFTQIGEAANFGTLEGKIEEINRAKAKLSDAFNSIGQFMDGDNVDKTAIADYFKGTSDKTREEIAKLIQDINDGNIDVENALKKFDLFGVQSVIEIEITEVQTNFKDAFTDLENADGLINTFQELADAIGSTSKAMDALNAAQAEMDYSGRVSIETALKLMESTDDYSKVLTVSEGKLVLAENAEENLITARIQGMKASALKALEEAKAARETTVLARSTAETALSTYNSAIESEMAAAVTATAWDKVLAAAAGLWAGIKSLFTSESWTEAYDRAYQETLNSLGGDRAAEVKAKYATAEEQAKKAQLEKDIENADKAIAEQDKEISKLQGNVDLLDTVKDDGSNIGDVFKSDDLEDPDAAKEKKQDDIKDGWEALLSKYENQLALLSNERDLIQAEIDKAEARGGKASTKYYDDLIDNSNAEKALLIQKKAALEEYLEANAGTIDQDTWTDYNNEINETAVAIKECEINTLEWAEAIREIDLHYFEQASEEISRLGDELEFVNGLLEDEEVADENGNWSSAALTRMGLYANQMEMAAANAARYQGEIDDLNDEYDNGAISEEQYQERLSDLVSSQQDAIMSYEDAKDSIVELNEARIDAIREGIEKEIEAYEDLIDAKKEELDAERDLHDFRKNIQKQTKDIASLERRIASLSGSSAASDIAERRKLEQQLMEAKEGLNDTYYDHSRDAQSAALDEENEAYALSKEKYIERLEEQLKDTETLISNSIMDVMLNADTVYNELNTMADTYGITLSDELTQPWKDASAQAIKWKDELKLSMTSGEYASLIGEGGAVTAFANGVATKLQGSWTKAQTAAKNYAGYLTGAELKNGFANTLTGFGNQIQTIIDKWNGVKKAADDAYAAQTRKVTVGGTGSGDTGGSDSGSGSGAGGGSGSGGGNSVTETPEVKLRGLMQTSREMILGSKSFVDANTETINGTKYYRDSKTGYYYKISDLNSKRKYDGGRTTGWAIPKGTWFYTKHAKGTTGTDRDEWAIDSEPQFGDELVLVPGKDGNLSFMRKGTGVVPADMTQKLFELAQIPTSDLMNKNLTAIVPNITKNDFKNEFNFESLVHVDKVDSDTLPKLEKMVDKKIDDFSKALNYSLKRFAR